MNKPTRWEIKKIINVANELQRTGTSRASQGEVIAAAFVLNKPEYFPEMYSDMMAAWERLGEQWQQHVRLIKQDYMHLIEDDIVP